MTRLFDIRPAREDDRGEIVELLRTSLGPNATEELWAWKHLDNPFGPSPCLIAEADGEMIGVRAFMRWTWSSGDREIPALRAVDTATRPDWHRRGVFSALTRELVERTARDGFQFVFNTPNRLSRPQYLRLGWQRVGRVPVWLRVASALPRKPAQFEWPSVDDLLAQPGIEGFLARCRKSRDEDRHRFRTRRDAAYLAWRYGRAPGVAYGALWSLSADRGAAVVFRTRARGRLTETVVAEILATPGRDGAAAAGALLVNLVRRCGTRYVAALAPARTAARAGLRRARFIPVGPVGPVLTVRLLARDPAPEPLQWSNWACSLGDLELF